MEVTLSSFEVWWAGPNCSVTFNLSKSVEKSMENQQADNWKWKNGQIWRFALLSGRSITQSISTDIAGNGLKLNYKVKVVCGAVCDFETGWFRWSMWWSFGLRCSLGKNSSYICSLTSITIKPWVNLKSCFLQLNNEKRGGGVFFTNSSTHGAENSVIVAVSEATREFHPVRKEEFDTRRSRYSKFMHSRRRRCHVRKPHEYRDKRTDTGVNHVFFREWWSCCRGGNRLMFLWS